MKRIFIMLMIVFTTAAVSAQNADFITEVLESSEITSGQAAYFCAVQADIASPESSYTQALVKLKEAGIISSSYDDTSIITLKETAYLIAITWDVKSSLMYRAFPGPRYAYLMLCAEGIIDRSSDPDQTIDGHTFMNMLTECIDKYEQ